MNECSTRSRNPLQCFSFRLPISLFLSILFISTIAQTRSSGSSNILSECGDQNQLSFTYRPAYPEAGKPVRFTDGSQDQVISWEWDFGDGKTSAFRNRRLAYRPPSSYRVNLLVGGISGPGKASRILTVSAATPVSSLSPSFTSSPGSPASGQAVQFTATSWGTPTSWQRDFNDGLTSKSRNPIHAFKAQGSYNLTLTVTNEMGSNSTSLSLSVGLAGVIQAASPSLGDVRSAISIAKPGDTVIIPAGSATWTDRLEITKPIKLLGAGIGNTVITSDYHPSDPYRYKNTRGNYLITYYPSDPSTTANIPCRISGFTLNGGANSFGIILFNPTLFAQKYVRIDHTRVYNLWGRTDTVPFGGRPFQIWGEFAGVADNNIWGETTGTYITVDGVDKSWAENPSFRLGTADSFYFEDNTFYGVDIYMIISSEMSAKFCVRYNTFNGDGLTTGVYSMFDAHGNTPHAHCATMGTEIYENDINVGSQGYRLFDQRGGQAMVFNNRVVTTGGGGTQTRVREEASDYDGPYNAINTTTGQPQRPWNSYYWGNSKNTTTRIYAEASTDAVDYTAKGEPNRVAPQENVDFWNQNDAFDGRSGVGVGLLSARPTSGLSVGVGYWATDTKTLYKCTGSTTWIVHYTPYTYPHPLREK